MTRSDRRGPTLRRSMVMVLSCLGRPHAGARTTIVEEMTARTALTLAALLMFVAVAAGAFGAHALRNRLTPEMSAVWQTAVQYHAWHALGLAVVALLTI